MKHDYGFSAARERIADELFMMISCQFVVGFDALSLRGGAWKSSAFS